MSRLHSALACLLWFVLFNAINSIKYSVTFEPSKLIQKCKNTEIKAVQDYIDTSNLSFTVESDARLVVHGTIHSTIVIPSGPLVVVTTFKQKLRGRWIDLPYIFRINDLCKDYLKVGTWWYDNITKYFVGDQRVCPTLKNVLLPMNFTAAYDLSMPAPLPEGEYMARSIAHLGENEACMDNYGELRQV